MKSKCIRFVALVILAAFVAGCATSGMRAWGSLSPKEKSYFFMKSYLTHAVNADKMLKDPKATADQKAVAEKKKELLTKAYPAIKMYDALVVEGKVPSVDDEQKILDFLDQLAAM